MGKGSKRNRQYDCGSGKKWQHCHGRGDNHIIQLRSFKLDWMAGKLEDIVRSQMMVAKRAALWFKFDDLATFIIYKDTNLIY